MKVLVLGYYSWLRLCRSHFMKALWGLAFFVGVAVLGTNSDATTVEGKLPSVELGITLARYFVWLAGIWIGMSGLSGEITTLTARTLLTKPVSRFQTTVGLLLGGAAALLVMMAVFAFEIAILAWTRGVLVEPRFFLLLFSLLPPVFAIMALAQLLSLFFARPITAFFMVGLSFERIWQYLGDAIEAGNNPDWFKVPLTAVYRLLFLLTPTFSRFVHKYREFLRLEIAWERLAFHVFDCLLYSAALCLVTAYVLSRKEI